LGRNLYNPDGDAEGWRRPWNSFGTESAGPALASAGRILPLITTAHCPSAANNNYWPEMYFNMAIVDENRTHPYKDTPTPKRFGAVSPLDPEFFSGIDEFAGELLQKAPSGRYSPVWVAERLEEYAGTASTGLKKAKSKVKNPNDPEFRRMAADVAIQAGLGNFFAAKFRAGVLFAIYERSRHRPALEQALKAYHTARDAWAGFAQSAKDIYCNDITFGPEYFQRGDWLDRLPAIDADIADMQAMLDKDAGAGVDAVKIELKTVEQAMRVVLEKPKHDERPLLIDLHTPPMQFRRGEALAIIANVPKAGNRAMIDGIHLRYRRVNQAEAWQTIEMERGEGNYRAVIPSAYTDSSFPLQYHFQIRGRDGEAWLCPGLEHRQQGQPYFIVRQKI